MSTMQMFRKKNDVMKLDRKLRCVCVFSVCFAAWQFLAYGSIILDYNPILKFQNRIQNQRVKDRCPGVLHYMTSGTWKARKMTSHEAKEIHAFYINSRRNLPNKPNYERSDLKCGNLTYTGAANSKWFRVLCNPDGSTPCCFKNRCMNKTIEECRGPTNYDLRSRIHAEYATWVPEDKRCAIKFYNSETACHLLDGSTIVAVGDSLMRNLYTALLMILNGDFKDGAFKPNTPKEMRERCKGMYIFPHKDCREFIDFNPVVCNGSLNLQFRHYPQLYQGQDLKRVSLSLKAKTKSMIFVGIGLWDRYDLKNIINEFVNPTLKVLGRKSNLDEKPGNFSETFDNSSKKTGNVRHKRANSSEKSQSFSEKPANVIQKPGKSTQKHGKSTQKPGKSTRKPGKSTNKHVNSRQEPGSQTQWPKILWYSAHKLGIWKFPAENGARDDAHARQYNEKMAAYLSNYNIPVFNTFNMTDGVMSIDGTHYGIGVNFVKAQMFLNYIHELKENDLW